MSQAKSEHKLSGSADNSTNSLDDQQWRAAVDLWLRWHSEQEQLTSRLFKAGDDQRQIERQLDTVDQIRLQAVELSERLIQSDRAAA